MHSLVKNTLEKFSHFRPSPFVCLLIVLQGLNIKFFSKFIIKPDVNIFLYASSEVILRRKQELDFDSIVDLTSNYKDLFCEMEKNKNGKYICIENINKEATIRKIIGILEERGI